MSRHLIEQAKELIEELLAVGNVVTQKDGQIETLLSDLQRELDIGTKYKTDNYLILRFDQYGSKICTVLSENGGYLAGKAQAEKEIQEGLCDSAVVVRVLWNSKDKPRELWSGS